MDNQILDNDLRVSPQEEHVFSDRSFVLFGEALKARKTLYKLSMALAIIFVVLLLLASIEAFLNGSEGGIRAIARASIIELISFVIYGSFFGVLIYSISKLNKSTEQFIQQKDSDSFSIELSNQRFFFIVMIVFSALSILSSIHTLISN